MHGVAWRVFFTLSLTRAGSGSTSSATDSHRNNEENARLRLELESVRRDYGELRRYVEGIEAVLRSLPVSVTDWVAGILKMSPLHGSKESSVDPK